MDTWRNHDILEYTHSYSRVKIKGFNKDLLKIYRMIYSGLNLAIKMLFELLKEEVQTGVKRISFTLT